MNHHAGPRPPGPGLRRPLRQPLRWAMPLLLAVLLLSLPVPAALAACNQTAVDGRSWTLEDASGHRWGLSLFAQPDPDAAAGWRLRLTARSPGLTLDHQRPLLLGDGLGAGWSLPNRSEELVPAAAALIPQASAQFDAGALVPRPHGAGAPGHRPHGALPLLLELPLEGQGRVARISLHPAIVQALHELP